MQGLYDSLGVAPAVAGRFTLRPHWRQDYPALVAAARRQADADGMSAGEEAGRREARPRRFGCDTTYKRGAAYLSGVGLVADWGCGTAYFKRFVPAGCYRGIDSSPTASCDEVADLASYTGEVDGLFLRHLLEHDLRWRRILGNALASFRRRMVLVVSTPFVRATEEHHRVPGPAAGPCLPEIRFCRRDLIRAFGSIPFRLEENIPTDSPFGREHVFYLCKDGPA
jgi:hypothetical protein